MTRTKDSQNNIRHQSGLSKFIARKEIKELPSILWEGEKEQNIIQGNYSGKNGVLVATNRRVIFIDKGMIKLTVEDFPYDKISSIQYTKGVFSGKIIIYASGNRAEITSIQPSTAAQPFAEFIRSKISGGESSSGKSSSDTGSDDSLDKLEKLASMAKRGIITKEEFLREKKKILG